MGQYADMVKKLTSDPGAQYLGGVADAQAAAIANLTAQLSALQTALSALQATVASCCGSATTPGILPPASAKEAPSATASTATTPLGDPPGSGGSH